MLQCVSAVQSSAPCTMRAANSVTLIATAQGDVDVATVEAVLARLKARARPDQLAGMARFGLTGDNRLGVTVPDMRKIARETGKDHALALALWQTKIPEAMMVASMVDQPELVTDAQMEAWVQDFNAWDVCDQVCMNLFEKTPLASQKIHEWSLRPEEFVKRAAYALIAGLAWRDKQAPDEAFIALLTVIKAGATDRRNYVKKAVSWALRNIGKRNANLHAFAIATAQELRQLDAQPAKWIAADTIRDLNSAATRSRVG
jgi:3-methyladenine DNA glycosylase AlkD